MATLNDYPRGAGMAAIWAAFPDEHRPDELERAEIINAISCMMDEGGFKDIRLEIKANAYKLKHEIKKMLPDLQPTISGFLNAAADSEQDRITEALYRIVTQHRRMANRPTVNRPRRKRSQSQQPADEESPEVDYWDCTVTVENPFQRARGASLRVHHFRSDSNAGRPLGLQHLSWDRFQELLQKQCQLNNLTHYLSYTPPDADSDQAAVGLFSAEQWEQSIEQMHPHARYQIQLHDPPVPGVGQPPLTPLEQGINPSWENSPDHCEHTETSPDYCEHTETSPDDCEHTETSPDDCEHTETSPDHCEHTETSPDHCEHTVTPPNNTSKRPSDADFTRTRKRSRRPSTNIDGGRPRASTGDHRGPAVGHRPGSQDHRMQRPVRQSHLQNRFHTGSRNPLLGDAMDTHFDDVFLGLDQCIDNTLGNDQTIVNDRTVERTQSDTFDLDQRAVDPDPRDLSSRPEEQHTRRNADQPQPNSPSQTEAVQAGDNSGTIPESSASQSTPAGSMSNYTEQNPSLGDAAAGPVREQPNEETRSGRGSRDSAPATQAPPPQETTSQRPRSPANGSPEHTPESPTGARSSTPAPKTPTNTGSTKGPSVNRKNGDKPQPKRVHNISSDSEEPSDSDGSESDAASDSSAVQDDGRRLLDEDQIINLSSDEDPDDDESIDSPWDDDTDEGLEGDNSNSFGPPTQLFERADDAEMQIFQAFYKLQGQEGLDRDDVIHIPGLKKGIKPYQAFGAMYMLRCEKPLNGGFLADEMGLGKTITAYAVFVLHRWITMMGDDVRSAWDNNRPTHLRRGATQGSCPSAAKFPIRCLCEPDSPTNSMRGCSRGPTLIFAPLTLLHVWTTQWDRWIDTEHPQLRLQLVIGHGKHTNKAAETVRKHAASLCYTDTRLVAAAHAKTKAEQSHTVSEEESKALQAWKTQMARPPKDSERFLVLTTPASFASHVVKPMTSTVTVPVTRRKASIGKCRGDIWSRAIRDESHEERSKGKTAVAFETLPQRPPCWFLSGTPYDKGPADMQHYVAVLEQEDWATDSHLMFSTSAVLCDIETDFKAVARERPDCPLTLQHVTSRMSKFLQGLGYIRRTAQSLWGGRPILELPPNHHRDIDCKPGAEAQAVIAEWSNQAAITIATASGGHVNRLGVARQILSRLRLVMNVPGLGALYDTKIPDRQDQIWTVKDLDRFECWAAPEECLFNQHLSQILTHSAKWDTLRGLIQDRPLDESNNGKPAKMLVMGFTPVEALIFLLAIRSVFPEEHADVYRGESKEREEVVSRFQNHDTGEMVDGRRSPGILLGSIRIMAAGVTLTKATRTVLLEPQESSAWEDQAKARVHRTGQMQETYSYRLLDPSSERDVRILRRHAVRSEIVQGAHGATDALKGDSETYLEYVRRLHGRRGQGLGDETA